MTIYFNAETHPRPNGLHAGAFLGLAFGVTWPLAVQVNLRGDHDTLGMVTNLRSQMLLHAFNAIARR